MSPKIKRKRNIHIIISILYIIFYQNHITFEYFFTMCISHTNISHDFHIIFSLQAYLKLQKKKNISLNSEFIYSSICFKIIQQYISLLRLPKRRRAVYSLNRKSIKNHLRALLPLYKEWAFFQNHYYNP